MRTGKQVIPAGAVSPSRERGTAFKVTNVGLEHDTYLFVLEYIVTIEEKPNINNGHRLPISSSR